MKFAFSTLGCPGWGWDEICTSAKDIGMNGIEIRGIGSEIYAARTAPFLPRNIEKTLENLKKINLEIPMLTSSVTLADTENSDAQIAEAKDYIDLASKIGAPYIRVMAENTPDHKIDFDVDKAAAAYAEICDYANSKGVCPLIETNARLADSKEMKAFLLKTNRDNAFVLWDIHHPYRFAGEDIKTTLAALGDKIKYVHVKDSVLEDNKVVYKTIGSGDLPVKEAVSALKNMGYDGYLTLEWVKRWNPELSEPGIVFYHYADYIKSL